MKRSGILSTLVSFILLLFILAGCGPLIPGDDDDPDDDTPIVDATASTTAVQAGIDLLTPTSGAPDIDGARAKMLLALQKNPNNGEALLWSSLFELASISIDPKMSEMMTEYVGMSGYPTSMNDLFTSNSWMTMQVVDGDGYVQYMPAITIPQEIKTYYGDVSQVSNSSYTLALISNFVTRNPDGFNSLSSAIIDDLLITKLDSTIAAINAVPATTKISIPEEMLGSPNDVVIGKAELLIELAVLQNIKSSLYMAKSISSALPLTEYYAALNPVTNPTLYPTESTPIDGFPMNLLAVLVTLPTPFSAGFLSPTTTAAASLASAKTATLAGLQSLSDAAASIKARVQADGYTFGPGSWLMAEEGAPAWSTVQNYLAYMKNSADKSKAAISTGATLYVPVDIEMSNPEAFIAKYAIASNWPSASDLGDPATWSSELAVLPTAIATKPAAAFETPLFALSSLFDMDTTTGEPKFYLEMLDGDGNPTGFAPTAATSVTDIEASYAIKIKDLTMNRSIVIDEDEFDEIKLALADILPSEWTSSLDTWLIYKDGVIEVYIPLVTGDIVAASLDSDGEEGSFWWATPDLVMEMAGSLESEVGPE